MVEFQPDGSISLNGTFEVLGGSGKYEGATGGGAFNGALPPGTSLDVGTVVTFDVDGKARIAAGRRPGPASSALDERNFRVD